MVYIANSELTNLVEFWDTLDKKFFARLNSDFHLTIRTLLSSLRKRYVVSAFQAGRHDKVREFFETLTDELAAEEEWRAWFGTIASVSAYEQSPPPHGAGSRWTGELW